MPRILFYARVSTQDQRLDLQLDEARRWGVPDECIYVEKASGAKTDRPEFEKCLAALSPGDTLMAWRLDRIGRSMLHLCKVIEDLTSRGIFFKTCDGIGTDGATGKFVLHIFAAAAELERTRLIERVVAGQAAARARGKKFGPKVKFTPDMVRQAEELMNVQKLSGEDAARVLNVSRRTLVRGMKLARERAELLETVGLPQ
jgi:DNA invertase Pin-like site-specific DNA recombinase